jgi:hypothetical protein
MNPINNLLIISAAFLKIYLMQSKTDFTYDDAAVYAQLLFYSENLEILELESISFVLLTIKEFLFKFY